MKSQLVQRSEIFDPNIPDRAPIFLRGRRPPPPTFGQVNRPQAHPRGGTLRAPLVLEKRKVVGQNFRDRALVAAPGVEQLRRLALIGGLCFSGVLGCSDSRANIVAEQRCASGLRWVGAESTWQPERQLRFDREHVPAAEMHPGRNCIACHNLADSDAPRFVVAGTVYGRDGEANDCLGQGAGATVVIRDANDQVYELAVNQAGNFYLALGDAPDFSMPYEAKVVIAGRESIMPELQSIGSCNFCHTRTGIEGAPGRILWPAADGGGQDAGVRDALPSSDASADDGGTSTDVSVDRDGPIGDGPQVNDLGGDRSIQDQSVPPDQALQPDQRVSSPDQGSASDQSSCGAFGFPCASAAQCCSNTCSGPPGGRRCR